MASLQTGLSLGSVAVLGGGISFDVAISVFTIDASLNAIGSFTLEGTTTETVVRWGDGNVSTSGGGTFTPTNNYGGGGGTYTVQIEGPCTRYAIGNDNVTQWRQAGTGHGILFESLSAFAQNKSALTTLPPTIPDTINDFTSAFDNTGISSATYSNLLIYLAETNFNTGVPFGAAGITANSSADAAIATLLGRSWTIVDGVFTLASLFSGSDEGGAYVVSPSTTWTDAGRTTPAGVGDAIAVLDDSSGNGNHLSVVAGTATLRQNGSGVYYLEGAAARLSVAVTSGYMSGNISHGAVFGDITTGTDLVTSAHLADSTSIQQFDVLFARRGSSTIEHVHRNGAVFDPLSTAATSGYAIAEYEANASPDKTLEANGNAPVTAASDIPAPVTDNNVIGMFGFADSTPSTATGDIGDCFTIGRLLTAQEKTDLRAYFAARLIV